MGGALKEVWRVWHEEEGRRGGQARGGRAGRRAGLSDGVETIATVPAQENSVSTWSTSGARFGWNELQRSGSHTGRSWCSSWGPMPWLGELAVIPAILEDYKDFGFLLVLLLINGLLHSEEFKAGNAVDELKKGWRGRRAYVTGRDKVDSRAGARGRNHAASGRCRAGGLQARRWRAHGCRSGRALTGSHSL